MEIEYIFVNGEKATVEVSGEFEKIILELDRNLYNNNRAETRRHISLSVFDEDNKYFTDTVPSFEEQISNQIDRETLYKAISKLNSDEKELLHNLYLSDRPMTQKQYANILGVTENAVQLRLEKLKKKLKILCLKNRHKT